MQKKRYELVTHRFKGGRFDDHGLDVDVLPELIAYKTILVETAKELWRRRHPNRQRLPKNFEDSLSLKFYEIVPGSAAVPLMREIEIQDGLLPFEPPPDELDEAVDLVTDSVELISKNKPFPMDFPKNVIPLFSEYGRTLRANEIIELKPAKRKTAARYSLKERDHLVELAQTGYEDIVDLVGEIRAADLDGGNFALRLVDETKVTGKFSPEQETIIIEALREHTTRRLHIKGHAEFLPDGKLKRVIFVTDLSIQSVGEVPYDETAKPIWEIVEEISTSIPDEEWAKLPSDLSKNLNHYLYGAPKQKQ
jgi:hypothetical protein